MGANPKTNQSVGAHSGFVQTFYGKDEQKLYLIRGKL